MADEKVAWWGGVEGLAGEGLEIWKEVSGFFILFFSQIDNLVSWFLYLSVDSDSYHILITGFVGEMQ